MYRFESDKVTAGLTLPWMMKWQDGLKERLDAGPTIKNTLLPIIPLAGCMSDKICKELDDPWLVFGYFTFMVFDVQISGAMFEKTFRMLDLLPNTVKEFRIRTHKPFQDSEFWSQIRRELYKYSKKVVQWEDEDPEQRIFPRLEVS